MVTSTHQYSILQPNSKSDDKKSPTELRIDESLLYRPAPPATPPFSGSVFSLSNRKRKSKHKMVLSYLDIAISFVVIGPCVIGAWRGTWELFILYRTYFPAVESLLIGNLMFLVIAFCQETLQDLIKYNETNTRLWRIGCWLALKLYVCICYMATMLTWYGGWETYDIILGVKVRPSGTAIVGTCDLSNLAFIIMVLIMIPMKILINVNSVPIEIALDYRDQLLQFPLYFKLEARKNTVLYILDCLFSVLVVGTLVVFVWRGAWVLIDIFLFPEDEKLSAWGSLVLGYVTVAIAFLLQPIMRWICDRATGACRLFVADFFILFAFFGTVNVWRGIWNLLNLYFLPDNMELSCWITHWVCLIVLILLGCSNSLLVRGVYIDAEEPAGKCVVFPCYYLRIIFQQEQTKQTPKLPMHENMKAPSCEKPPLENNHVINVSTIDNVIENHTKL